MVPVRADPEEPYVRYIAGQRRVLLDDLLRPGIPVTIITKYGSEYQVQLRDDEIDSYIQADVGEEIISFAAYPADVAMLSDEDEPILHEDMLFGYNLATGRMLFYERGDSMYTVTSEVSSIRIGGGEI